MDRTSPSRNNNMDDNLSDSSDREEMGVKASYIEKVIVQARRTVPTVSPEITDWIDGTGKSSTGVTVLHRTPLFSENNVSQPAAGVTTPANDRGKGKGSPPRPPSSIAPSRASTARPRSIQQRLVSNSSLHVDVDGDANVQESRSAPSTSKRAVLENRVLIRLANVLPNEQSPFSPQPGSSQSDKLKMRESRNVLLQLNRDLDDLVLDFRNNGLESEGFSFGDMTGKREQDASSHPSDNNPLVLDEIIAELGKQAIKKVQRLKKLHRSQLSKLKKKHDEEVFQLKFQLDTLSSRAFSSSLDPVSAQSAGDSHETQDAITAGRRASTSDPWRQHDRLIKSLRDEHDKMQDALLARLEAERKLSLEKVRSISGLLHTTQEQLQSERKKVEELTSLLLDREREDMELERTSVVALKDALRDLLKTNNSLTVTAGTATTTAPAPAAVAPSRQISYRSAGEDEGHQSR